MKKKSNLKMLTRRASGASRGKSIERRRRRFFHRSEFECLEARYLLTDLFGDNFRVAPANIQAGETFTMRYNVRNTGDAAGAFSVNFYVSKDESITQEDLQIHSVSVDGLSADSELGIQTIDLLLPPETHPFWEGLNREYRIGMIVDVDNSVAESNEENNSNNEFNEEDWDDIFVLPSPDLFGDNFLVSDSTLEPGDDLTVGYNIRNSGNATGPFDVGIYLSRNQSIDRDDLLLQTVTIDGLDIASATGRQELSVTLPEENDAFWDGFNKTYRIGMIIDVTDSVAEANEENNSNHRPFFNEDSRDLFVATQPDLFANQFTIMAVADDLGVPPSGILEPGYDFNIQYGLRNRGVATEEFEIGFYLSRDDTITSDDFLLSSLNIQGIEKDSSTGTQMIGVTLPDIDHPIWGFNEEYRIGIILDVENVEDEFNEDNNANHRFVGNDWRDVRVVVVDVLCRAIRQGRFDPTLEFDLDGVISLNDINVVLSELRSNHGDANLDGQFNSGDLVTVFQKGEFEDDVDFNSTWYEGDWNCDGDFTTSDLVFVFQKGTYGNAAVAAAVQSSEGSFLASEYLVVNESTLMSRSSRRLNLVEVSPQRIASCENAYDWCRVESGIPEIESDVDTLDKIFAEMAKIAA